MKVIKKILWRIALGLLIYICSIQPILWKYTLETFKPARSSIERIVNIKGLVLHREELVTAPVSGIFLRLKKDNERVGKGEKLAVIFPTIEDYNSYVKEIDRIEKYYEGIIKERMETIKLKEQDIEKIYKELAKEGDILNSLVLNRQDIGERVKKLGSLNNRINSLKTEVEKLNADVESLVKERDKKIKEFKEKVISLNSVVLSSSAGLVVFATDSKESLRSSIIEGKMEGLGRNFNYILGKPKITSDGDMVKKGEPLGKIIDNLEQFAILYVVPDGVAGLPHNNLDIYIGDGPVSLELLKWIKEGSNEIWFCTVRDKRYIESSYFSLDVKIGDIEGMVVPRELIKEENNKSYILILNKDSIEKRIVKILGGNRERVVLDNIKEGEILVRN